MKKILSALLIALMLFSVVACGDKGNQEAQTPANTTDVLTPIPTEMATATPTQEPAPTPTIEVTATPAPTSGIGPVDLTKFTTLYVSGSVVNVREEATTSSKKITSLPVNTPVKSYKVVNGWHYISYADNHFGFMAGDYLSTAPVTVKTPAPSVEPPASPAQTGMFFSI